MALLLQEPPTSYARLRLHRLDVTRAALRNLSRDPNPQHVEDTSKFAFILALSSDVVSSTSMSLSNVEDLSVIQLPIPSGGDHMFLDRHGHLVSTFELSPVSCDSSDASMTFTIVDGDYVHPVVKSHNSDCDSELTMATWSPAEISLKPPEETASRAICLTVLMIELSELASSTTSGAASPSVASRRQLARDKAKMFLQMNQNLLNSSSNASNQGVVSVCRQLVDVYDILKRQKLAEQNTASSESLKKSLTLLNSVVVVPPIDSPHGKLLLLGDTESQLLRSIGAKELAHPAFIEIPFHTEVQRSASQQSEDPDVARRSLQLVADPGPSSQSISMVAERLSSKQKTPQERQLFYNVPTLQGLLKSPEIVGYAASSWSSTFMNDMLLIGYEVQGNADTDPQTRQRDATQYLKTMLAQTTTVAKQARAYLSSAALTSPTAYWSRDVRNFVVSIGFSASSIFREPCSKRPHIPPMVRYAVKCYLEDVVDDICNVHTVVPLAKNLRMIAQEQIAEYEFCDSLLSNNVLVSSSSWPPIVCEVLRLLDFQPVQQQNILSGSARGSTGAAPPLFFAHASPSVRQAAVEHLKRRHQLCPMESMEETIRRRCVEILASPFLVTANDTWPDELRAFFLMLDFMPNEMKLPSRDAPVISRDVRDRARMYLEYRVEGKDPKLEIARVLLTFWMKYPSSLRLPLTSEHLAQLVQLVGFPLRDRQPDVSLLSRDGEFRAEAQRFLTDYIRVHDTAPRVLLTMKELLRSQYLASEDSYWPKELRKVLAGEGFFPEELNVPVHLMVQVPRYLRVSARIFIEAKLREWLLPLISSFPDAEILAFPGCTTIDESASAFLFEENSMQAQSQWSALDKTVFQRDSMKEDTVGSDPASLLTPGSLTALMDVLDSTHRSASNSTSTLVGAPTDESRHEVHHAVTGIIGLRVSAFLVEGCTSMKPAAPLPIQNSNQRKKIDLGAYLAASPLAKHEFEHQSIRSVASVALVHDGAPTSTILASNVTAALLSNFTWAPLTVQPLCRAQGGFAGVTWTPLLLGSTEDVSDISAETSAHVGIFQRQPTAPSSTVNNRSVLSLASQIASTSSSSLPTTSFETQESAFGAPPSTLNSNMTTRQPQQDLYSNPYKNALVGTSRVTSNASRFDYDAPQQPQTTQAFSLSLSPVPVARRPVSHSTPSTTTIASRAPPSSSYLRSRIGMRSGITSATSRPQPVNPFASPVTPPRSTSINRLAPTNPFSTSSTVRNDNPFASQSPLSPKVDSNYSWPNSGGGYGNNPSQNPAMTSNSNGGETDADILRMIKSAEVAAGITPPSESSFSPPTMSATSSSTLARRAEAERRRQEALIKLRNDRSRNANSSSFNSTQDETTGRRATQAFPSNTTSSIAPRRAPVAMTFDTTSFKDDINTSTLPESSNGIGGPQRNRNIFSVQDTRFGVRLSEQPMTKEEIDRVSPVVNRRRERETLTISPLKSPTPASHGRRIDSGAGFEILVAPEIKRTNPFDCDMGIPTPASRLDEPGASRKQALSNDRPLPMSQQRRAQNIFGTDDVPPPVQKVKSASPFDDVPVGPRRPQPQAFNVDDLPVGPRRPQPQAFNVDDLPVGPRRPQPQAFNIDDIPVGSASRTMAAAPRQVPSGLPPLSGGVTSQVKKPMTTSERLAAAAARRQQLQTGGSTSNTPATQTGNVTNPYAAMEDKPIRPAAQNPFQSNAPLPHSSTIRNPFAAMDNNSLAPRPSFGYQNTQDMIQRRRDEELALQIREEQRLEAQQQKEDAELQRQRRQQQLVQDRLRRRDGDQSSTPQEPSSSLRPAFQWSSALRRPDSVCLSPSSAASPSLVIGETSFSFWALLQAVIDAKVDMLSLNEDEKAIAAIFQSSPLEICSVVVPPILSLSQEVQPCVVISIPLSSEENHHFRLMIRVHNMTDLCSVFSGERLMSVADLGRSTPRQAFANGCSILTRSQRWKLLRMGITRSLHSITLNHHQDRSSHSCVNRFCDPLVTESRLRLLAVRLQLTNQKKQKAATRVQMQLQQQQHMARLGVGAKQDFMRQTIFTAPLETIDDHEIGPLDVALSIKDSSSFSINKSPTVSVETLPTLTIVQLIQRQRLWLDGASPFVSLNCRGVGSGQSLREQKSIRQISLDTGSLIFLDDLLSPLQNIISCAGTSQVSWWHDVCLRIACFSLWIFVLANAEWWIVALCCCICLGCCWTLMKALCNPKTLPFISGVTDTTLFQNHENHSAGKHPVDRVSTVLVLGVLFGRASRLLRGKSIVASVLLVVSSFSVFFILAGLHWILRNEVPQDNLTDRDRYLGLSRHIDASIDESMVIFAPDPSAFAVHEAASMYGIREFHVITGLLLVAPWSINPLLWAVRTVYAAFLRDVALHRDFVT